MNKREQTETSAGLREEDSSSLEATIDSLEPGELEKAELEHVSGGCNTGTHIPTVTID